MEKRTLLQSVLAYFLLIVIMIAGAIIASALVVVVAAGFTQNIEIMVTSSLIGVWVTEILIIMLRSRFFYNRKIKEIDKSQIEKYENETKKLKKRYVIQIIVFALFFGFVMYNQKNQIVSSLVNETQQRIFENISNSPLFYIRLGIVAIIVFVLIMRKIMQKRRNNNETNPNVV